MIEKLIEIKKAAGLTWTEISHRSGVSRRTITNWVNYQIQPTLETFITVIGVMGYGLELVKKEGVI